VAFTALITSQDIHIRNKFNRKVTDFVILNKNLEVLAIIELDDPSHIGQEARDAARDAMFHDAGYRVIRYTTIPSVRQLQKDLKA
jgi:very-short-patch-repair endonuclease